MGDARTHARCTYRCATCIDRQTTRNIMPPAPSIGWAEDDNNNNVSSLNRFSPGITAMTRCSNTPSLRSFLHSIKKHTHTLTHTFNGPLSGTTRVSRYQKGETNLDFTEARDSEWQWHQLGRMQVCTSLQTDNHTSTPPLSLLQAGYPSCRPTNSVKACTPSKSDTEK